MIENPLLKPKALNSLYIKNFFGYNRTPILIKCLEVVWICGRSSAVEHNLAKVGVDGSNPFARSIKMNILIYEWYQLCPGGGMVDTGDLKSPGHCDRAGSSPAPGTI